MIFGDLLNIKCEFVFILHLLQGDQKVSTYMMITTQKSGAQRLFDHLVFLKDFSF